MEPTTTTDDRRPGLRRTIRLALALALLALPLVACESDGGDDDGPGAADVATGADTTTTADATTGADSAAGGDASGGDDATAEGGPSIVGTYTDAWGTAHEIAAGVWTQTFPGSAPMVFDITEYDDDAQWIVAQNHADNEFNPGAWSRFDWTWYEEDLWYCQTAYDAASEEDALATPAADPTDPASAGCGPGGWTNLTP